jgi:hypothetical protein
MHVAFPCTRPGWAAVLCAALAGCVGAIGEGPGNGEGAAGPEVDDSSLAYTCTDAQAGARGASVENMRRLSRRELENTLAALLGSDVIADEQIAAKLAGLPIDETVIAGDFTATPPLGLALGLSLISKRAVEVALAKPDWRAQHLPSCADDAAPAKACVESVVRDFGGRVWRRDLSDAEVQRYLDGYVASGEGQEGLAFTLRRLLQAPSLVFHIEMGTEAAGGRLRLTDFEVASRISYLTTDSPPDEALVEAARSGDLQSVDGVRAEVDRLLASDAARAKTLDFFRYYAHLGTIPDPLPVTAAAVGIDDATGLGQEMRDEAFAFFDHVFWSSAGDFTELLSSTAAFPRSSALAQVFGSEVAAAGEPVTAPSHVGLLHRPALLASPTLRTSPIVRGAHTRKLFLCDALGMPDPAAVAARQEEVGDIEGMSNRDKATTLTSDDACIGCHGMINPVGFSFEGFDPVGVPRSSEVVLDETGAVVDTWPLDTSVAALTVDDGEEPRSFASSTELALAIADGNRARACIARRMFEYYRLSAVDKDADSCTLHEAEVASHEGNLQSVLAATIANEDIFWKKEP